MAGWRLSRQAEGDIEAVWRYGAQQFGIEQANRLLDRLEVQFRLLAAQPHGGRQRDDIRPGLRCLPFESYIIYYRVKSPGVHILRIWGGR